MIYDKEYYERYASYNGTQEEQNLMNFRAEIVGRAVEEIDRQGPLIVDYGCAAGGFLEVIRERYPSKQYVGVDINPYCIAHCTTRKIQVYSPDMFDYFYKDERVDIMTFWDTMEHLRDPKDLLDLHKPKYICVSVPCLDGFEEAMPGEDIQLWKHYRPEEHLWNFKEDTLIKFLEARGYKVTFLTHEESLFRVDPILGDKNIMTVIGERIDV